MLAEPGCFIEPGQFGMLWGTLADAFCSAVKCHWSSVATCGLGVSCCVCMVCPSVCLSVYLSTYLSIYRSISIYLYLCLYLCLYLSLSMSMSMSMSIYLCLYLPIYLSNYLPIYLSTYNNFGKGASHTLRSMAVWRDPENDRQALNVTRGFSLSWSQAAPGAATTCRFA